MNTWLKHVSDFRKKNPHLSYKECLQKAKTSYHKSKKGGMLPMAGFDYVNEVNSPQAEASYVNNNAENPPNKRARVEEVPTSYAFEQRIAPSRYIDVDAVASQKMNHRNAVKYGSRENRKNLTNIITKKQKYIPRAIKLPEFITTSEGYQADNERYGQMQKEAGQDSWRELLRYYKLNYPNMTDKQIRELAEPEFRQQFIDRTLLYRQEFKEQLLQLSDDELRYWLAYRGYPNPNDLTIERQFYLTGIKGEPGTEIQLTIPARHRI